MCWHSQVGQEGVVVEIDHREEAIVKAQADEELQSRPGPGNPEAQEREGKERPAAGECLQTLQDHLRGRDLGPRPEQSNTTIKWDMYLQKYGFPIWRNWIILLGRAQERAVTQPAEKRVVQAIPY